MERSTIFNWKTHYKWPFSIAMLNYRRVYNITQAKWPSIGNMMIHQWMEFWNSLIWKSRAMRALFRLASWMARGKGAPVVLRIWEEQTGHDEVVFVSYMDHARIQYLVSVFALSPQVQTWQCQETLRVFPPVWGETWQLANLLRYVIKLIYRTWLDWTLLKLINI